MEPQVTQVQKPVSRARTQLLSSSTNSSTSSKSSDVYEPPPTPNGCNTGYLFINYTLSNGRNTVNILYYTLQFLFNRISQSHLTNCTKMLHEQYFNLYRKFSSRNLYALPDGYSRLI